MVKRVLFHLTQFKTGGGEMSTLRMLNALADRRVKVTLALTESGGSLEPRLDPRITVIHLRPGKRREGALVRMLRGSVGVLHAVRLAPMRFDAAVVGMTGAPTWLVRYVVRADRKLHFIRNDLSSMNKEAEIVATVRRHRNAFDAYVCVSAVARQSLIAAVPEVAGKAHTIYNVLNAADMRARAGDGSDPFPPRRTGAIRILSVCRLSERAKGLTRMARICGRLDQAGLDFDWFVMGDGPDRPVLEAEIAAQGVEHRMHLMGPIANPFPGYANADVVAMLSHYEGLCGVVNEAKVTGRAVVATRVSGIGEQLVDGETGLIVEQDEDAIFTAMHRVLVDPALRERLSNDRLPPALMDDEAKIDRLCRLFGMSAQPGPGTLAPFAE
ncbi:MAG: glycosyltransferase [Devosia sp.]